MIVHQRYLLPQQLDLLLILTQILLACLDVVLTKELYELNKIKTMSLMQLYGCGNRTLLSTTYLNRLYALLDIDDLRRVRNIPVHVLAYDAGSGRDELN